jgi:hypothetical protein
VVRSKEEQEVLHIHQAQVTRVALHVDTACIALFSAVSRVFLFLRAFDESSTGAWVAIAWDDVWEGGGGALLWKV